LLRAPVSLIIRDTVKCDKKL